MRAVSLKAVVIGNLADIAINVAVFAVILFSALVIEGAHLGAATVDQAYPALTASGWFGPLIYSGIPFADFLAGFISGQIAEENKPMNGALATAVRLLLIGALYIFVANGGQIHHPKHHIIVPEIYAAAVAYGGPVYSALGGLLAAGIAPGTFWRWLAAFPVAIATYLILLLFSIKFFGLSGLMGAATMAVIAGAVTVPSEHRKQAFAVFAMAIVLIPVAILVIRIITAGSSASAIWPIYNIGGVALAYPIMKRSWQT